MFKRVWVVFMIFLLLLMPVVSAAEAHESRFIDITDVIMTFDGEDANITVEYSIDGLFARLYLLVFGPDAIRQKLEDVFADFSNIRITDISWNKANITANDVITYDDGIYRIHAFDLGQNVDKLYIIFPNGYEIMLEDINATRPIVHKNNTQFIMFLPA
ncbi:MAG: hypothetical protein BME93_04240 [Methanosarcinales archaeon Met12]|nr:MAG: hypothetical protein BME93_04240 [Methanosarcinales archaeon Met12]